MGQITLVKPSGGQITLSPEDGSTTENLVVPAAGMMAADAPVGKVLQVQQWRLPPTSVSTAGSWAAATTPTRPNTYSVGDFTFNKLHEDSTIYVQANGMVDVNSSSGGLPTVVCLLDYSSVLIGSAYFHVQYRNTEPYAYTFSGKYQTSDMTPTFYLTCHSSGEGMHFSRTYSQSSGSNPYTITFTEVMA